MTIVSTHMGNLSLANWFDTTQLTTEQLLAANSIGPVNSKHLDISYEIVTLMFSSMWSFSPSSNKMASKTLPIVSLLVNVNEGL